jgi:hypothetical protein
VHGRLRPGVHHLRRKLRHGLVHRVRRRQADDVLSGEQSCRARLLRRGMRPEPVSGRPVRVRLIGCIGGAFAALPSLEQLGPAGRLSPRPELLSDQTSLRHGSLHSNAGLREGYRLPERRPQRLRSNSREKPLDGCVAASPRSPQLRPRGLFGIAISLRELGRVPGDPIRLARGHLRPQLRLQAPMSTQLLLCAHDLGGRVTRLVRSWLARRALRWGSLRTRQL